MTTKASNVKAIVELRRALSAILLILREERAKAYPDTQLIETLTRRETLLRSRMEKLR